MVGISSVAEEASLKASKIWHCKRCDKTFTREYSFERHKKAFHSWQKRSWDCKKCLSSFNRKDNLRRHVRTKHLPDGDERSLQEYFVKKPEKKLSAANKCPRCQTFHSSVQDNINCFLWKGDRRKIGCQTKTISG